MKMYEGHFERACDFTESLGFSRTSLTKIPGDLVSEENGSKAMSEVMAAGIKDLAPSALQCLKWSHALRPLVEKGLGCKVVLTIGRIFFGERPIFDPTQTDFDKWAKVGIDVDDFGSRSGFNFHAWYTLPTMEILDLTLRSTLAVAYERPELAGQVVGGWPDKIAPHPLYVPMVVGDEYAEKVHKLSEVPVLASSLDPDELASIPMVLALRRG